MQVLRQAPPTCRNPVHCDGCSCAPDTRASLKARFAHASALALPEGWDLLIRDGELVVGRYGRPVGAVMVCECCGHEFLGDPNGARLCNRNDCVAAVVKMHVDRTVRALGPSSAASDADEGADAFGDGDDDAELELVSLRAADDEARSPRARADAGTRNVVTPDPRVSAIVASPPSTSDAPCDKFVTPVPSTPVPGASSFVVNVAPANEQAAALVLAVCSTATASIEVPAGTKYPLIAVYDQLQVLWRGVDGDLRLHSGATADTFTYEFEPRDTTHDADDQTSRAARPPLETSPMDFSVGDRVAALWEGNYWYPGVVDKVLEGEYDIAWDGEEVNNKVPVEDVRALHLPPPLADLEAAADAKMSEAWPAGVLPRDALLAQLEQLGLGQFDALYAEARPRIVARAAAPDAMQS